MNVIWHDIECGHYDRDLAFWRELAERYGDPVLELGAGTGRVTLDLARRGHDLTALDQDGELLAALAQRADGLRVRTAVADARTFTLKQRFALCIVPMQTLQLLGGRAGRLSCLRRVRGHLAPGGAAAFAISSRLETYEARLGTPTAPLPDMAEIDGVVYSSQPTAVREQPDGFLLVRRRERVSPAGHRAVTEDRTTLSKLTPEELEAEAREAGLRLLGREEIAPTREYVGSEVVIAGA